MNSSVIRWVSSPVVAPPKRALEARGSPMSTALSKRLASIALAVLLLFVIGFCSSTTLAWAGELQGNGSQTAAVEGKSASLDSPASKAAPDNATDSDAPADPVAGNPSDTPGSAPGGGADTPASPEPNPVAGEPSDPVDPVGPVDPVDPANPADPANPVTGPVDPANPADPAGPADPADPANPTDSADPAPAVDPVAGDPTDPNDPADSANPTNPANPADPAVPADPANPAAPDPDQATTAPAPNAQSQNSSNDPAVSSDGKNVNKTELAKSEQPKQVSPKDVAAVVKPSSAKLVKAKIRLNHEFLNRVKNINLTDLKLYYSDSDEMLYSIADLFDQVLAENPGYDVDWTLRYDRNSSGYYYAKYFIVKKITVSSSRFNEALLEMVSWASEQSSKVNQAKAVHDWLVRNCSYNDIAGDMDRKSYMSSHYDDPWSAEGALVYRTPVCQGYALAFQLGMTKLGIPCKVVRHIKANHGWNRIKIDGHWYHVDVTWDDGDYGYWAEPDTKYFMKSDLYMRNLYDGTHGTWETKRLDAAGTSTKYDYSRWGSYSYKQYHAPVYSMKISKSITVAPQNRKKIALTLDDALKKPFHNFTWTSSNKSIATVTQYGMVTAGKKRGKTIVTCKGEGFTAKCTVWVVGGGLKAKIVSKALSPAKVTYNGKKRTPNVVVKQKTTSGKYTLKKGSDYTVSYQNKKGKAIAASKIKNAGIYYVLVKGKGLFSGTVKLKFTVKPKSIAKAKVTGVKHPYYNGKVKKQSKLVVKLGNKTLKRGTEYTVSYRNAKGKAIKASAVKKAGTYYVVIKGKGNYGNMKPVKFHIVKRPKWSGATKMPVYSYANYNVKYGKIRVLSGGKVVKVKNGKTVISKKTGKAVIGLYDSLGRYYAKRTVKVYKLTGEYALQSSLAKNLVLDIEHESKGNGAKMIVWNRKYKNAKTKTVKNQRYSFKYLKDGTYAIRCQHSGKFVDVDGASKESGRNVIQWQWNGKANQRWRIYVDSKNRLTFRSKLSGQVFDVNGGVPKKGRNMIQWPSNGGLNQKWILKRK